MDLIVGMFNFIYHMNIVIKTGVYIIIISWVIFNHARPTYETIRNIKSNHALESSHGETAMTA